MKYCVIKGTTKIIDGSNNPTEIMLQNAKSAGLKEDEVEILTEEEYQARKELEPKPTELPSLEERLQALEQIELDRILGGISND